MGRRVFLFFPGARFGRERGSLLRLYGFNFRLLRFIPPKNGVPQRCRTRACQDLVIIDGLTHRRTRCSFVLGGSLEQLAKSNWVFSLAKGHPLDRERKFLAG